MNALKDYYEHIEAVKKRIAAVEKAESQPIPKDLFMKLKFKEFKVTEGNYLEFTECKVNQLELNYEIEES